MESSSTPDIRLFEQVRFCPLCNSSFEDSSSLYKVKHLNWNIDMLECANCGLTYKSYIPTPEYFLEIYSNSYNHYSLENIKEEIELLQHRLKRIGTANGRLLDYGCGNGSFVLAALNEGWDAFGIDPFLPDVLPQEVNTRCFKVDISKTIPSYIGTFQCITMWATAEHLVDSKNTFLNLFSLLDENGVFIFNSPFGKSKIALKNGPDWHMSNIVEHLQFHTFKSIEYLSSLANITTRSIRICGSPYPLGRWRGPEQAQLTEEHPTSQIETPAKGSRNLISSFKKYVLSEIISKNKFRSKDIISYFMNLLKNGDHLEIILRKK